MAKKKTKDRIYETIYFNEIAEHERLKDILYKQGITLSGILRLIGRQLVIQLEKLEKQKQKIRFYDLKILFERKKNYASSSKD